MQKILRKRILRDFKKNSARYLALALLIIFGMYLVISLAAAADTIIIGSAQAAAAQSLEDGQFSLFTPLTDAEKQVLEDAGVTTEPHFYLDFQTDDGSVLRVSAVRKAIDLVKADTGRLPAPEQESETDASGNPEKKSGRKSDTELEKDSERETGREIFLEKRFCEEHGISVGDKLQAGGYSFTVCGIGTSPDYDTPYRNLSDSAADSARFGTAFVNSTDYQLLRDSGSSLQSEEYVCAYLLNHQLTDRELKKLLQGFVIAADDIDDIYFQEYWQRTGGKADEFKEALSKLASGSDSLADSLEKLDKHGAGLMQTAEISGMTSAGDVFENSIAEYTGGVSKAARGSKKLAAGISEFSDEIQNWLADSTDTGITDAGITDAGITDTRISKLTQFVPAKDNPRIGGAADDVVITKAASLFAGVLLVVLSAYVISVFTVHTIERESEVIGTLYALGVKRKELLSHYLFLPVMLTMLAGMAGTALGCSRFGVWLQMRNTYQYFSIPGFAAVCKPYLFLYGILMPPAAAALMNWFVIRRKLKKPALSLMRREQKSAGITKIKIPDMGFVRTFQVRQLFREARTAFTIFFGMFLSLLVCMTGINCYVLCEHVKTDSAKDTRYQYLYTYKYPEQTVPDGGEEAYGVILKKEVLGHRFDVTLLGIHPDNPYFDAPVSKGQHHVMISETVAGRYRLQTGADLILDDDENEKRYVFTIDGIVPYSAGMSVFMDIGSMRELFGEQEDYYNLVFADHALDINPGRLSAVSSKTEVEKGAAVFTELMRPMVIMMISVSALVFIVVMYLMQKVMTDRCAASVSMMKIFGYRKKEIRRLYLDGNLMITVVSAAAGIPLSKALIDAAYPYLVSNAAVCLNLTFSWKMYAGLSAAVLVLHGIYIPLLMRRINGILPAEVLKNRE